jgi:hypothetical protein
LGLFYHTNYWAFVFIYRGSALNYIPSDSQKVYSYDLPSETDF